MAVKALLALCADIEKLFAELEQAQQFYAFLERATDPDYKPTKEDEELLQQVFDE